MADPVLGAAAFGLCLTLSALAYYRKVLTASGTAAAFAVGLVIGVVGDISWLLLLLFFLLSSFAATKYRFALKEALGVQEGKRGERGAANVLANGAAPVAVSVLAFLAPAAFPKSVAGLVFVSTLAVAGADTLASEIGVLSRRTRDILSGRPVPPGTDGGVSWLGQGAAFAAALYTALFAWLVLYWGATAAGIPAAIAADPVLLAVPVATGFAGCQIDSVLGTTLETRHVLTKKGVNFVSTALGGVLAYGALWVMGAT
jgi:uncharacterized protein (TIGR00297 family)